jgi:alpha-L-rhamnosidase
MWPNGGRTGLFLAPLAVRVGLTPGGRVFVTKISFYILMLMGVLALRGEEPGGLVVAGLRCDAAVDPLGVDSVQPRLSWILRSGVRSERQGAWQILAASSLSELAAGRGDLWDSGRVESDEQLNILYGGLEMRSAEQVFWKVRVWDGAGHVSAWSAPATWTMGLLAASDWHTRWITDADLLRWVRPVLGYRSHETADPNTPVWVQVDLGMTVPIESVRLCALRHTVIEKLGFPNQFKVEASDDPDFKAPTMIADFTAVGYPNPWTNIITLPAAGVSARYVRLTATKLRVEEGMACLGLSQLEVMSGGRNVALDRRVTASDSVEDSPWAERALTDGLALPGANPSANATVLFRREFRVRPDLRRALAFVCGLGQYELTCNGVRAGDDVLSPGWTDYEKSCLYDTRDITALLKPGANAVGLSLAGGFFNVQDSEGRYGKFVSQYRPLMAIGQIRLEYTDGTVETIVTDANWHAALGPITYANVYGGEDYDARTEPAGWGRPGFDDSAWVRALSLDGPGAVLRGGSHADPAITEHEVLSPVAVREIQPGITVYDLGQNAALMLRLRVHGPAGSVVKVTPAELVKPDGSVDRSSVGGGNAYWNYTLAGRSGGEAWDPRFFYHGARYLQVERAAPSGGGEAPAVDRIEGVVVHSDSPAVGEFACSSDLFNRIHVLVRWAQRSNLMHVLTDCPDRERLGWLEQYHLNGPALRYDFDLTRLYAKGFEDMEDAQQADGLVPDIAPEYVIFSGGFRDSPEWGSALILAAWQHYIWTGDDAPLRDHYDAMMNYVTYLRSRSKDSILDYGLGDWYDRGPLKPGRAQLTPVALTATAFYQNDVATLAQIAGHLGKDSDAERLAADAEAIRTAFNHAFFDPATGRYATGSQTAQALPLVMGLAESKDRAAVLGVLVRDVQDSGNAGTAGDVGYRYLLRALADAGRSDVIAAMNSQSDKPGYGYQLAMGATSLTEAWDADRRASQDHFMLGQIVEWFYHDLAGLAPDPGSPGFKRVLFRPQPVPGVIWARAAHDSPRGHIAVAWRQEDDRFVLDVETPPNTTAEVRWPFATTEEIDEGKGPAGRSQGVEGRRMEEGHPVYSIASGKYEFSGPLPAATVK